MKDVHLFSYRPFRDQEQPDVCMTIRAPIPECKTLEAQHELFISEAEMLGDALVNALPQGTVDQLLIYLLQHKASLLVVKA